LRVFDNGGFWSHRSDEEPPMRPKSSIAKTTHGGRVLKDVGRATRRQFSAEEKTRILLDSLRTENSIAEICRRESMAHHLPPTPDAYWYGLKSLQTPSYRFVPAIPTIAR
jgi:hypothetical protein